MFESLTIFQWVVLLVSALCIGMSKTGVQGLLLLIVPYMAMAFGAKESTGIILPMLCMADVMAVSYYRHIADWQIVLKLLPAAVVGLLVAVLVDRFVPAHEFRLLMGWTLAIGLVVMIWNEIGGKGNNFMNKWWYGVIFGLLGGFTTMIGNAAGPVMAIYLLSMRTGKMSYIGINAWFFLVINILKLPLQIFAWNNISWSSFALDLSMLPVIGLGALLGIKFARLLPEKVFHRFIQLVTIISVAMMLV